HHLSDALHHLNRTRCSSHDSSAQTAEIETVKIRVVQLSNKHGRNAMKRRATLIRDRFENCQRIEGFGWVDHRGAMRYACQIAQHHTEAVIQRHGNAQSILMPEPHSLAYEEPIVQDIMVGQGCTFGIACRTAGELNVDWIIELKY